MQLEVRKYFQAIIGITFIGVGVAFNYLADLGLGPWGGIPRWHFKNYWNNIWASRNINIFINSFIMDSFKTEAWNSNDI